MAAVTLTSGSRVELGLAVLILSGITWLLVIVVPLPERQADLKKQVDSLTVKVDSLPDREDVTNLVKVLLSEKLESYNVMQGRLEEKIEGLQKELAEARRKGN